MAGAVDKLTRFDAALFEDAVAEGQRQERSGRQQLEHWARVGRAMTAFESASLVRVRAALAGTQKLNELTDAEGRVFNAEVEARIAESLAADNYQAALAAQGVTTVSLDDDGRIIEHRPDGTTRILDIDNE